MIYNGNVWKADLILLMLRTHLFAEMVEMADTPDLGSGF